MSNISDLEPVALVAQGAARQEVFTSMEAHQRFSPSWEIQEVAIHYALRNGLLAHFKLCDPKPRVGLEYDDISNIDFPPDYIPHCVDLAILHPLVEATEPNAYSGYAWADENKAVLGLIEVKNDWWTRPPAGFERDVEWLAKVSTMPPKPDMRELEWVMLVLFLAGRTKETVDQLAKDSETTFKRWTFRALTQSNPSEVLCHPGSANIADRWFEVMCYGKGCSQVT